jgi:hypothetical protein
LSRSFDCQSKNIYPQEKWDNKTILCSKKNNGESTKISLFSIYRTEDEIYDWCKIRIVKIEKIVVALCENTIF